jgi:hypothetical protein
MLAPAILASALFIGSAIMLPYNAVLSYGGIAAAIVVVVAATFKKLKP